MTTFTDEDLKRLKEIYKVDTHMRGLIARLEAAEDALIHEIKPYSRVYASWRKAAGK